MNQSKPDVVPGDTADDILKPHDPQGRKLQVGVELKTGAYVVMVFKPFNDGSTDGVWAFEDRCKLEHSNKVIALKQKSTFVHTPINRDYALVSVQTRDEIFSGKHVHVADSAAAS